MITLKYDFTKALIAQGGLHAGELDKLASSLEAKRDEIFQEDLPALAQGNVPPEKQPLDTAFVDLPQRLLAEYDCDRESSELGQILRVAKRLRDSVDRVVVLGIGGSYMGARALMDACCHPYHNELERGARGSRPRMYFEGNNVDNDACQGLLDLLPSGSSASLGDRWALVVISKSGGTLETAVAFRLFLQKFCSAPNGADAIAERVIPVTGASGKLFDLATQLGCREFFRVPEGVGGRFSVLSAVGLLPAAILGLDVVKLLQGAAAMTDHFRTAPASENLVLQYTAVSHLMEKHRGALIRVLQVWSKSLESLGLWYDQLLAESLGKTPDTGATPLTVVNTRDLHSRAQQHQEGRRDKMYTNLIVDKWRTDPLVIPSSDHDEDQLNQLAGKTVPEVMTAAIKGTNQAYNDDDRPTTSFHFPQVDESTLGQFLQLMMLATVVEGRLLQINPYGQPGVEAYKINMKKELNI
jgi:glucose-6-phosphate isomerase